MARLIAFGGLALVDTDGPMAGSAARGRNLALLALLARAGDAGLTRDKLAALLWPESDEARARHSLDQALYTLRQALGADVFLAGGSTLALNGAVLSSDVGDFDGACERGASAAAIDAYAGAFLDGFHLSNAPDFEEWVAGERARLQGRYVALLESSAVGAAARGERGEAVALWRSLAAAEPLGSRVALGLMRALVEAGDRAGAIEAARVHAALVHGELGAPPDPAVLAYERELRGAPVPGVPHQAAPAGGLAPASGPPAPRTQEPMAAAPPAPEERTRWRARTRSRPRWVALAAVAGVVMVGGVLLRSTAAPPRASGRPSVVVTPFVNETADAAMASLGPMAADWITRGLVRTGIVDVIAADEPGGAERSGRADLTVVSGRIYGGTGDTVWLQASIARASDGRVLRSSEAVSAPGAEPSRALEPLRQQVLGALATLFDPRLATWAETALRPPTYAAFQELAAGLELFAVPRDLTGATVRFRRAAELDPGYVLPRLWLAWASMMQGSYAVADSVADTLAPERGSLSPVERSWLDRIVALLEGDNERSFRAARRMVEVAPNSGWVISLASAALDTNRPDVAVTALERAGIESLGLEKEFGWFLLTAGRHAQGDYVGELQAAEEGIRSSGLAWGYMGPGVPALAALGRLDALERRLDELRGLPPLDDGVPRALASLLGAAVELRVHGRPDAAAALVDRRLADVSDSTTLREPGRWTRTVLLYEMGRWDRAAAVLRGLPAGARDALPYRAMAALLAARAGDTATARSVDAELAGIGGAWSFGEPTFWRARIHAALGDDAVAVDLLRRSFAEGRGAQAWHEVHVSRDFDALRGTPSFDALVRPAPAQGAGAAR